MIDFLNPKTKKIFIGRLLSFFVLIFILIGIYLIFSPIHTVWSDDKKTNLNGLTELPANLPPENYILTDLHLPINNIINQQLPDQDQLKENTTKVLGVSYNQSAKNDLIVNQTVNKIIIPKMGVDSEILEGNNEEVLWRGIWRMPIGSTPSAGGNTIITAHRYLHRPPSPKTFYLLDKLQSGDIITLYWEGEKYEYKVSDTKIIEPDDLTILHNTASDRLTLFSCTPLFTSQQRLVVIAEKI